MKSTLFVISLMLIQLASCPQKVNVKAYAFFTVKNRGTLLVDDQGQPIQSPTDTSRFIIIEVRVDKTPSVDTVVYRNRYFLPGVFPVENEVRVGKGVKDDQEIIIRAGKNKKLLKVELSSVSSSYLSTSPGVIKIIGRSGGIPFILKIDKEIEMVDQLTNSLR